MTEYVNLKEVDFVKPLMWLRRFARENENVQYASLFISEDGVAIIRCTLISFENGKHVYSYKVHGKAANVVEFYDVVEKLRRDGAFAHKKIELANSTCQIRLEVLRRRGGVKDEALRLRTAIMERYQADGSGEMLYKQRLIPFAQAERSAM